VFGHPMLCPTQGSTKTRVSEMGVLEKGDG
jgi:hypothetical protein